LDNRSLDAFRARFESETYAAKMGMRLIEIAPGHSIVEMVLAEEDQNIFSMAHGGAIFSLIDESFEAAANSHGPVAVALNVSVHYHNPARPGDTLRAEAMEVSRSRRISTYGIEVRNGNGNLIATCQAMAYIKNDRPKS
jgi:acyl-CoA thioesterase